MDKIIDKLKEYKNITPHNGFVKQSLEIILSISQNKKSIAAHVWESFRYSLALSLGTILLVVALGGFSYLHLDNLSPVLAGSLNTKGLLGEAEKADFSIKLAEAKYFDDAARAATVALNIISQNDPDHLNGDVLMKELQNLDKENSSNGEYKSLIDDIVL